MEEINEQSLIQRAHRLMYDITATKREEEHELSTIRKKVYQDASERALQAAKIIAYLREAKAKANLCKSVWVLKMLCWALSINLPLHQLQQHLKNLRCF